MTFIEILLFFLAAAGGSAINSVAGGGTFLVFPILTMYGMSPFLANIMCTIALWPGTVSSAIGYRRELYVEKRLLFKFMLASVAGSVLGAELFLNTSEVMFENLIPWLLLGATMLFTFGRRGIGWLNQFSTDARTDRWMVGFLLQFIIAVYGGYFGAGIGILMLAMLQLMGMHHIHQMNALKTVLGSTINAIAFIIFCFSEHVVWSVAAVMIAGAVTGGYIGARMALKVPVEKIRLLISAIGFALSIYYFF